MSSVASPAGIVVDEDGFVYVSSFAEVDTLLCIVCLFLIIITIELSIVPEMRLECHAYKAYTCACTLQCYTVHFHMEILELGPQPELHVYLWYSLPVIKYFKHVRLSVIFCGI